MAMIEAAETLTRFRGCLVGALLGDCLGAPYEADRPAQKSVLNKYFKKHEDRNLKIPYKAYTDDAAMTKALSESIVGCKGFDANDLARKFVQEYFMEPNRGYGSNVVNVFAKLRATKFQDLFLPAAMQFGGAGSYGNGGAMRISPVALLECMSDTEQVINTARQTALLTHSNRLAYNGAILQCLAVHLALNTQSKKLDPVKYVNELCSIMVGVEKPGKDEVLDGRMNLNEYTDRLKLVLALLEKGDAVAVSEVDASLGTSIAAHQSVPTAIYVFLRAMNDIKGVETINDFQRTIHYAISLGGDTDTIASMAGSIAGAYYGIDSIPYYLQKHCEAVDLFKQLADQIHAIVFPKE